MKIGIIKETKIPEDNRVALSPQQVAKLQSDYSGCEIVVQASDVRSYRDDEYRCMGINVVESVDDCDVLFGIKRPTSRLCYLANIISFSGILQKCNPIIGRYYRI